MRPVGLFSYLRGAVLATVAVLALTACGGKISKRDGLQAAPDVPAVFDLTFLSEKDGQFDLDGATLSEEDIKGHLRYRKDQGKPVQTILLKRAEKQKVTDRHINELARIAVELQLRAFVQEKAGREIAEIRVSAAK